MRTSLGVDGGGVDDVEEDEGAHELQNRYLRERREKRERERTKVHMNSRIAT